MDILDRLRKRRFPMACTTAYAGNIASAAYMRPQSGTFVLDPSKPDEDIDDAIKEIERLRAAANKAAHVAGKLHADLYGMQDGSLLRDLQAENARIWAERDQLLARLKVAVPVLDAITTPEGELRLPTNAEGMARLEAAFAVCKETP